MTIFIFYISTKKKIQMLLAFKKGETLRKHAHAIYRNFHSCKNYNLHMKKCDIFLFFAQNIDCGYTIEPPQ